MEPGSADEDSRPAGGEGGHGRRSRQATHALPEGFHPSGSDAPDKSFPVFK